MPRDFLCFDVGTGVELPQSALGGEVEVPDQARGRRAEGRQGDDSKIHMSLVGMDNGGYEEVDCEGGCYVTYTYRDGDQETNARLYQEAAAGLWRRWSCPCRHRSRCG